MRVVERYKVASCKTRGRVVKEGTGDKVVASL